MTVLHYGLVAAVSLLLLAATALVVDRYVKRLRTLDDRPQRLEPWMAELMEDADIQAMLAKRRESGWDS